MVALSCFSNGGNKESSTQRGSTECLVELLDDTSYKIKVKKHCRGQSVMDEVCKHLNILETDYFGLRLLDEAKTSHWLDLQKSLIKEIKRHGLNSNPVKFYFGVKFYATDPCKLREEITRYQFFLQLKRDVLDGRISLAFDSLVELCSLVVQSDLGDYNADTHTAGYVSELRLAPQQSEDLEQAIASSHQKLLGFHPSACEYMYLDKMKWQDMYGVDLHLVKGAGDMEYCVGLTPSGVVIYRQKVKVNLYYWPRISGITFKGKKLSLKVRDKNGTETTYYFTFDKKESCKSFWKCCIEHHTFFRLSQADVSSNILNDFFHLGSKFRYSGRTEKELALSEPVRNPQTVTRTKSQRQERRQIKSNDIVSALPLALDVTPNQHADMAVQTPSADVKAASGVPALPLASLNVVSTDRQHMCKSPSQSYSSRHNNYLPYDSTMSSAGGQELNLSWTAQGGLYTSGKESPKSVRSEKMKFPSKLARNDSGSEADSVYTRRRAVEVYEEHKSNYMHVGYNRRESDNESERSALSRRRRRRYQRSYDSASDGESVANRRRRSNRHNESLREGSVCSGVSTPRSDMVSTRTCKHYRDSLSRTNITKELAQHLHFALQDTNGLSDEQLKDIGYKSVKLKGRSDANRISPSDTYERTTSNHSKSAGLRQATTPPAHSQTLRRLSSCSYENILYDKSGSAHFIDENATSSSQYPRTDYGEVIKPPRDFAHHTQATHNGSSLPPSKNAHRTRRVCSPIARDDGSSSVHLVQPVPVYRHTGQRPAAKIVETQHVSSAANMYSTSKAHLYSHGKNLSLANGHSTLPKQKHTSSSPNDSFYAQYSSRKTTSTTAAIGSPSTSPLKISNI